MTDTRTRGAVRATASLLGASLLAGAAALHVVWGRGSSWPAADRRALADVVAGTEEVPDARACLAVATLLAGAAGTVAARPAGPVGRTARGCIAAVLAVRGLTGLTGTTGLLVPWTPSIRFVELDRRCHGPLCLAIAALVASDLG